MNNIENKEISFNLDSKQLNRIEEKVLENNRALNAITIMTMIILSFVIPFLIGITKQLEKVQIQIEQINTNTQPKDSINNSTKLITLDLNKELMNYE